MTPPNIRSSLALAAALLALTAAPAAAQTGHTLSLTGPASAAVGEPSVLQATGFVPEDVFLNRYVNVYAIPASVATACPATFSGAMQLSYASSAQGGDTVALAVSAPAGDFALPIAYTPSVPGRFVLCGYLHELVETMAAAPPLVVDAAAALTAPANVGRPKVVRSKRKLSCRRGAWTGSPTRYTYRWRVAGKKRGTLRTLRVTRAVRGRKVVCLVTASNAAGSATAVSRAVRTR